MALPCVHNSQTHIDSPKHDKWSTGCILQQRSGMDPNNAAFGCPRGTTPHTGESRWSSGSLYTSGVCGGGTTKGGDRLCWDQAPFDIQAGFGCHRNFLKRKFLERNLGTPVYSARGKSICLYFFVWDTIRDPPYMTRELGGHIWCPAQNAKAEIISSGRKAIKSYVLKKSRVESHWRIKTRHHASVGEFLPHNCTRNLRREHLRWGGQ